MKSDEKLLSNFVTLLLVRLLVIVCGRILLFDINLTVARFTYPNPLYCAACKISGMRSTVLVFVMTNEFRTSYRPKLSMITTLIPVAIVTPTMPCVMVFIYKGGASKRNCFVWRIATVKEWVGVAWLNTSAAFTIFNFV